MNQNCVFCKICRGDLPLNRVYEDADVLAFLDIAPVVKGHTLVIPKAHHDPITETPDEVLGKVIVVVRKVAGAIYRALGADGVSVAQANGQAAGQAVRHIHFHVIPRFMGASGHGMNWLPGKYESVDEARSYAERIAGCLS